MKLKTRIGTWLSSMPKINVRALLPFAIAAAGVLLGIWIQAALAGHAQAVSSAQAESAVRVLTAEAVTASRRQEAEEDEQRRQLAASAQEILSAKAKAADEREDVLILVNAWNPMPDDYQVQLEEVGDGHMLDARCAGAFLEMMEDLRATGERPYIASTYRTWEKQEELYEDKVRRVEDSGVSEDDAPWVAAQSVAVPGTSEHQLGLAVDILDNYYPYMNASQEHTGVQLWLMEHCWDYGFILRYPNGTTELTGIIYEPWHYRYVGVDTAREIRDLGVTLEEYLELRRENYS